MDRREETEFTTFESDAERRFREANVPYLRSDVSEAAKKFLPQAPGSRPTAGDVRKFVRLTRRDPDLRLEVLTNLRTWVDDRAALITGGAAMLFAALAVLVSLLTTVPVDALRLGGWIAAVIFGVALVTLAWRLMTMVNVVNRRRVTAATWLAAYEDALRR